MRVATFGPANAIVDASATAAPAPPAMMAVVRASGVVGQSRPESG